MNSLIPWISNRLDEEVAYQKNGITVDEKVQKIFGAYFFLSNERMQYERKAFDIISLLANFGGLAVGAFSFLRFLGTEINYNIIIGEFIEIVYFPFNNRLNKEFPIIKFRWWEILASIWFLKPFFCFINKHKIKAFKELKSRIEDQMNMITMITRLDKIIAIITVLMRNSDNQQMLFEAEKQYLTYKKSFYNKKQDVDLFDFIDNLGYDTKHNYDYYQNKLNFVQVTKLSATNAFNQLSNIHHKELNQSIKNIDNKEQQFIQQDQYQLMEQKSLNSKVDQSNLLISHQNHDQSEDIKDSISQDQNLDEQGTSIQYNQSDHDQNDQNLKIENFMDTQKQNTIISGLTKNNLSIQQQPFDINTESTERKHNKDSGYYKLKLKIQQKLSEKNNQK